MMTSKISVRNLVEFIMRSGDIDNRRTTSFDKEAMKKGSRIHRKIQKQMGSDYQSEVVMRTKVDRGQYELLIEGRADGVFQDAIGYVIDEIKGTYQSIRQLEKPVPVHEAQALCYAYCLLKEYELDQIGVQVTYCHLETEEIKRFRSDKTAEELELWFEGLIHEYQKWSTFEQHHQVRRQESIQALEFPYPYREGQKSLAVSVYRAIYRGANLFIQAPTGIGKTLSTVFPGIKAIGEGHGDKLFYLTAKTITRSVAEECFSLLRKQQLCFSTVTITAKEKLCFLDAADCNPESCAVAGGHFDRINDAIYDVIVHEDAITREVILEYAIKHQVCPFELCLDVSTWVDGIICDYNYVFDPNVRLKRYFAESSSKEYLYLIDEAHNLVARGREMFSAVLIKEDFLHLKKLVKPITPKLTKYLDKCNLSLLELKRQSETYQVLDNVNLFFSHLMGVYAELEVLLEEEKTWEHRQEALEFYFQVRHFIGMYEGVGDHYQIYTDFNGKGEFELHLFCVNPSKCLEDSLEKGKSAIFFSATLLPVNYYKQLLSGKADDFAIYVDSPFPKEHKKLLIGKDVSSRYTRRNRQEYEKIVEYIQTLAQHQEGNYMVFFPSYSYMEAVNQILQEEKQSFQWQMQNVHMSEMEREEFLRNFKEEPNATFVGFCVLGGVFSEGIDLVGTRLIGVIIVGTGLPMVCTEQEILRNYFDEKEQNGFAYAYQYPGMNKVMQAAGRVIRTATDAGTIMLLDQRFLNVDYQELFPREWTQYGVVTKETVGWWLENHHEL